jgi:DNA-binding MarR family transcriptional regulator
MDDCEGCWFIRLYHASAFVSVGALVTSHNGIAFFSDRGVVLAPARLGVYTWNLKRPSSQSSVLSFSALPCACANLRRAARAVSRSYAGQLQSDNLEITQFTLLLTLQRQRQVSQAELGRILALDSTTLTRTLRLLLQHGWIEAKPAEDRRLRFLRLTSSGRQRLRQAMPHWNRAQRRLLSVLGQDAWDQLADLLTRVTRLTVELEAGQTRTSPATAAASVLRKEHR